MSEKPSGTRWCVCRRALEEEEADPGPPGVAFAPAAHAELSHTRVRARPSALAVASASPAPILLAPPAARAPHASRQVAEVQLVLGRKGNVINFLTRQHRIHACHY